MGGGPRQLKTIAMGSGGDLTARRGQSGPMSCRVINKREDRKHGGDGVGVGLWGEQVRERNGTVGTMLPRQRIENYGDAFEEEKSET